MLVLLLTLVHVCQQSLFCLWCWNASVLGNRVHLTWQTHRLIVALLTIQPTGRLLALSTERVPDPYKVGIMKMRYALDVRLSRIKVVEITGANMLWYLPLGLQAAHVCHDQSPMVCMLVQTCRTALLCLAHGSSTWCRNPSFCHSIGIYVLTAAG